MLKANRQYVCQKCNADIIAGSHYAQWNKKRVNTAWHIKCENPTLEGYDKSLIEQSSTFFSKYPNHCRICSGRIEQGGLAKLVNGIIQHVDCNNPSGLINATRVDPPVNADPLFNPPVIEPRFDPDPMSEPSEPAIEPKKIITKPDPVIIAPSGDPLLDLIVNQVGSKLTEKVSESVTEVKNASKDVIDRLEKEIDQRLSSVHVPHIELVRPELPTITLTNVHKQFKQVLEVIHNARKYAYLWGAPGGGKSKLCEQIAEALGVRYTYLSLSQQSPEYWISGYDSPIDGKHYPSEFADFWTNGGLFVFEEIDAANDNMRTTLNTPLANGHFKVGKELIPKSDKFYCMSDGNTSSHGAHPAFPERTAFDRAFAARWFFIEIDYDWPLCKVITQQINPDCVPLVAWAEKASAWALANKIPVVISPREIYDIALVRKTTTLSKDQIFDGILRGLDMVSKEKLLQNFPLPIF